MAYKMIKQYSISIICLGLLILLSSCVQQVYFYEITVRNDGEKDILWVTVATGTETNGFGFLGSGKPRKGKTKGATAAGCPVSFNGATKITWKEDGKKREYNLNLKNFYAKRKQIKAFEFIYQGNDKWKVTAK
jgi:hypothetical protein